MPGKDTAQGIAAELVGAQLVDGRDMIAVAASLDRITTEHCNARPAVPDGGGAESAGAVKRTITFALNSYVSEQSPSEKALVGFAQLTITEPEPNAS